MAHPSPRESMLNALPQSMNMLLLIGLSRPPPIRIGTDTS